MIEVMAVLLISIVAGAVVASAVIINAESAVMEAMGMAILVALLGGAAAAIWVLL